MASLKRRAAWLHGTNGAIETRSQRFGSLWLKWWTDRSGSLYELRRGLYGRVVMRHFVKGGETQWQKRRKQ